MEHTIYRDPKTGFRLILTTDSPDSRHGIPVLRIGGAGDWPDMGPADALPGGGTAGEIVSSCVELAESAARSGRACPEEIFMPPEVQSAARAFLAQLLDPSSEPDVSTSPSASVSSPPRRTRARGGGARTTAKRSPGDWAKILDEAAAIVKGYDTGVTLRQLFYRLVSKGLLANTKAEYGQLSSRTAEARRDGWFPELLDRTREIHVAASWASPSELLAVAARQYRNDRTRGQRFSVYVGVEKHGLVEQLSSWFGDYGVPVLALGGYSSQTFTDAVAADVEKRGRPAVLIYGGDFDPSGEDIERDFVGRAGCFAQWHRVALTAEQITEHDLPPMMGKASDSRARGFVKRHGSLIQVELDALPPDVLRKLYADNLREFFDMSAWEEVCRSEEEGRAYLLELAGRA